jgi:hypothetical protein
MYLLYPILITVVSGYLGYLLIKISFKIYIKSIYFKLLSALLGILIVLSALYVPIMYTAAYLGKSPFTYFDISTVYSILQNIIPLIAILFLRSLIKHFKFNTMTIAQQGDAPEPDSCRSCLSGTTSRPGDL